MSKNRFMSSSNPFVGDKAFAKNAQQNLGVTKSNSGDMMTVQGAVNKSLILTGLLLVSAILSWNLFKSGTILNPMPYVLGASFLALGIALLSFFKPTIAPITAPIYALVEGVAVGMISAVYGSVLGDGIVINALLLTILCLGSMLGAYKTGLIKATKKFRAVVTTATGAIMMIYVLSMVLNMVGIEIPYLHQGGFLGIGISLFIIGIACLNLILDFDNIEKGAAMGAPKYMEWVSSLGLLITLVWIYLEILRLLAMLASSSD
ncbi:MAG: putative YccA/Bax inhibitor family protein [Aureispira sp.]|jgi:uncharacterized YccA/Bax inhibitor family protein